VVVAPVLRVPLLELAVHPCGLLHALQLQQQLPYERREGGELSELAWVFNADPSPQSHWNQDWISKSLQQLVKG